MDGEDPRGPRIRRGRIEEHWGLEVSSYRGRVCAEVPVLLAQCKRWRP